MELHVCIKNFFRLLSIKPHLVEIVKLNLSDSSSDARGNGLTSISYKVRNTEDLSRIDHIFLVLDFKVPVVGQLEREPGMISSFHSDDVSAEIGTQKKTEGLDDIGLLGFATRQGELSELFIRPQHHQLRSKYHSETTDISITFNIYKHL